MKTSDFRILFSMSVSTSKPGNMFKYEIERYKSSVWLNLVSQLWCESCLEPSWQLTTTIKRRILHKLWNIRHWIRTSALKCELSGRDPSCKVSNIQILNVNINLYKCQTLNLSFEVRTVWRDPSCQASNMQMSELSNYLDNINIC